VLEVFWSSSVVTGFLALEINPFLNRSIFLAFSSLYFLKIFWTILYDTTYVFIDPKYNRKAGIRSIAVAHSKDEKTLLQSLAVIQIRFLVLAGITGELGTGFFILVVEVSYISWLKRSENLLVSVQEWMGFEHRFLHCFRFLKRVFGRFIKVLDYFPGL
jgi:4-hydroxybenzoate polyprenyltransferase